MEIHQLEFERDQLPTYLGNELKSKELKICEIGVYEGLYANVISSELPLSEIHLIDLWDPDGNDFFYSEFDDDQMNGAYEKVRTRFNGNPNIKILKGDSKELFGNFKDGYFDWIYIDGDHSYEGVLSDLKNWFPKVKKGGVISGHDFDPDLGWEISSKFGVNQAIDDFFKDTDEIYLTSEPYYKSWVHFKK
jgi:hypothetical protein